MSFSDLMSSGKGPGVIGLLLALTVLGGFVILGTLTLDEPFQGGGQSIKSVIRQQEREIENLRGRLKDSKERLAELADRERWAKDLGILTAGITSQQESLTKKEVAIARLHEELAAIEEATESYKKRYRTTVRNAAKGTGMERLETLDGEVYHQVKVREVNSIGMLISHRDGSKRIPYKDLPLDMQDHFQFDAEEREAKAAVEALAHKKHLQAVAEAQSANKRRNERKRMEEKRATAVRRQHAVAAVSSRLDSLTDEIRNLEYDIESETRKKLSRAPQMREQLAKMEREKRELETKLRNLRADN